MNLEQHVHKNRSYRRVLQTTQHMQLVLMHLEPGEDIPEEVHDKTTQFIRVEAGRGIIYIDGRMTRLSDGRAVIVPPGAKHYVKATGTDGLSLYTIYSPPEHPPDCWQQRQHKRVIDDNRYS